VLNATGDWSLQSTGTRELPLKLAVCMTVAAREPRQGSRI
jgi:hypothetical protein